MPLQPMLQKVLGRMAGMLKGLWALEAIVLGQSCLPATHSRLVALEPLVHKKDWTSPLPDDAGYQAQVLLMGTRLLHTGDGTQEGSFL